MHIEMVIGGIGGQGALTAGQLLATAGIQQGKAVTNTPIYSPEVRGGSSNALVVVSDSAVGNMMVTEADAGVFLAHQAVRPLLPTLKPGARVVYNSTLVPEEMRRTDDVTHVSLPATDLAEEVGDVRATNMVALGALTVIEDNVPLQWLIDALPVMLGDRKMRFLAMNETALKRGAEEAARLVG